jgi:hypothetical protein
VAPLKVMVMVVGQVTWESLGHYYNIPVFSSPGDRDAQILNPRWYKLALQPLPYTSPPLHPFSCCPDSPTGPHRAAAGRCPVGRHE